MSLKEKVEHNWATSGIIGAILHEKAAPLDDHYGVEPDAFTDDDNDGHIRMTPYAKACINGLLTQRFGPDLAERILAETVAMHDEFYPDDTLTNPYWSGLRWNLINNLRDVVNHYKRAACNLCV